MVRLRGESFRQEYLPHGRRRQARRREPSMNKGDGGYVLPPQDPKFEGKIVLVLDLDETLIFARLGPLLAREGLTELFAMCIEYGLEVVVWTAGLKSYAQAIVENIDRHRAVSHCIYRHSKWFSGQTGYRKDLAALGRPLDKVLIIENTPDCIRGYQNNGILVQDYVGSVEKDETLFRLAEVIRALVNSQMSVPQFIVSSQMLQKENVQTDVGDYISVYTLAATEWNSNFNRVNMDLGRRACK